MSAETWADHFHEITLFLLDDLNSKCEEKKENFSFFFYSMIFRLCEKHAGIGIYGKLKSLCAVCVVTVVIPYCVIKMFAHMIVTLTSRGKKTLL